MLMLGLIWQSIMSLNFYYDFCLMSSVFHQAFYLYRDMCTLLVLTIFLFSTIDAKFYFFLQLINSIFLAHNTEVKNSLGNYFLLYLSPLQCKNMQVCITKVTRETINVLKIVVIHYFL